MHQGQPLKIILGTPATSRSKSIVAKYISREVPVGSGGTALNYAKGSIKPAVKATSGKIDDAYENNEDIMSEGKVFGYLLLGILGFHFISYQPASMHEGRAGRVPVIL